jgi:calcineurin-like phosphoesterase family protein
MCSAFQDLRYDELMPQAGQVAEKRRGMIHLQNQRLDEMSRIWFTADLHLGHGNIIKYCLRPYLSPEEEERALREPRGDWRVSEDTIQRHDNSLLENINAYVRSNDVLWILGDFCWGQADKALVYRMRIRCKNINLVRGNHDHPSVESIFGKVLEQGMVRVSGQDIWMNHYPMRSWNKSFHGSWHLYGHVHGRMTMEDVARMASLTKDIGVDACEYRPWSYEDLYTYMAPRIQAFNQRRANLAERNE